MATRAPIQKHIPLTEVADNLGDFLNRVYRGEEHVVIDRDGTPVAAIISMSDYEAYRRLLAEQAFGALSRGIGAELARQGLTEEQLFEELRATRREVFTEKYGEFGEA